MARKILVIGAEGQHKESLYLATLREKYGEDVLLYNIEEAEEQGLGADDFENIPCYKITAPEIYEQSYYLNRPLSGKEQRRKRRKELRKAKKKSK